MSVQNGTLFVKLPYAWANPGAVPTALQPHYVRMPLQLNSDIYFGALNGASLGSISGTVKIDGLVGVRMVRLIDRRSGVVVRQCWSGADGSFCFPNLRKDIDFMVIGIDDLRNYNAVIYDLVRAA